MLHMLIHFWEHWQSKEGEESFYSQRAQEQSSFLKAEKAHVCLKKRHGEGETKITPKTEIKIMI